MKESGVAISSELAEEVYGKNVTRKDTSVSWAWTYLCNAGFITRSGGFASITAQGLDFLDTIIIQVIWLHCSRICIPQKGRKVSRKNLAKNLAKNVVAHNLKFHPVEELVECLPSWKNGKRLRSDHFCEKVMEFNLLDW